MKTFTSATKYIKAINDYFTEYKDYTSEKEEIEQAIKELKNKYNYIINGATTIYEAEELLSLIDGNKYYNFTLWNLDQEKLELLEYDTYEYGKTIQIRELQKQNIDKLEIRGTNYTDWEPYRTPKNLLRNRFRYEKGENIINETDKK